MSKLDDPRTECDFIGSHLMNGPICDRCGWEKKSIINDILCDVMDWGSSNTQKGISPEKANQALSAAIDEVIGEDEDLNAPINRNLDGNPESDRMYGLHIIRRATRNVHRGEQCKRKAALFGEDV